MSVALGVAFVEAIASLADTRLHPQGLGWLLVPVLCGFAGSFVAEAARKWRHERQRRHREEARAVRAERAKAAATIRAAAHDPQFAAALRQAIATVEAGEDAPQAEPVQWVQHVPGALSGELMLKPSPPRLVGGAA